MKYIPSWLHCRLLRFAWYRRKCGIPEFSTNMQEITRAALAAFADRTPVFLDNINREYPQPKASGGTIKVRKPSVYMRREAGEH